MSDKLSASTSNQETPATNDNEDTFGQFMKHFSTRLAEQHVECTSEELRSVHAYLRLAHRILVAQSTAVTKQLA